jgi:2,4-dienoyl-CoA reductase (NADPH2)
VHDVPLEQIQKTVNYFEAGAVRAREVGFDAVEIHAAHGYTLAAFLSLINERQDEYGGNLSGRMKLATDVYDLMRRGLGNDYPIGIRFCGDEFIIRGNTLQQTRSIARRLAEMGLDYLSVSAGGRYEDSQGIIAKWGCPHHYPPIGGYSGYRTMPPAWMPEAVNVYLAEEIRRAVRQAGFSTPVITAGRIPYPELAENILKEEKADIIGLCRPLLRDPEWPVKARENRSADIERCTYCNTCLANECEDEPAVCIYRQDDD